MAMRKSCGRLWNIPGLDVPRTGAARASDDMARPAELLSSVVSCRVVPQRAVVVHGCSSAYILESSQLQNYRLLATRC